MSEAERLQKIVLTQEKEIKRLRKVLSVARVAHLDLQVIESTIQVTVTVIGADEYGFTDAVRKEIETLATAIAGGAALQVKDISNEDGTPMEGGVSPQP